MAAALLPALVAATTLLLDVGGDYHPQADYALFELRTRDIGHRAVLTGLYSREGWSHPGPTAFYVMTVPYWLTGRSSIGLPVGALAINAASVVGMALVARRLAGTPALVLTLLVTGVVVRALGVEFLADPWNPFLTVLPFGLLLFLCWAMACGRRWALPPAAAVATFCAQTHIGYLTLAFPLLAVGALALVLSTGRRGGASVARALAVPTGVAVAILAVLWAPPLLEQVTGDPGNITEIVRYFRSSTDEGHSLAQGLGVVGGQFGVPPEWVSGARPPNAFTAEHQFLFDAPPPVLLVPVVVAAAVLWRRRVQPALRLVLVLGVATGFGVLSIALTTGPLYAYRLRWTWLLAAGAAMVVGWAAWDVLARRTRLGRWLAGLGLASLLVISMVNTFDAVSVAPPHDRASSVLGELVPSVVTALPAGEHPVLLRSSSPAGSEYVGGLLLALERRGIRAQAADFDERAWASHRVYRDGPVRTQLTVAVDEEVDRHAGEPGFRRIAYFGMPDRERARRVQRLVELDAAHSAGELPTAVWSLMRAETLPPYSAVAVFSSPVRTRG